MTRRHDIDALRCIAFALLILYHGAMPYVDEWAWHLKSAYQAEWLQWPMVAMNRWRMPLLFLISGIAIGLFDPSRAAGRFALLRTWRLLLPLLFGMLAIVPVQAYCQGVRNGLVEPGFVDFMLRYLEFRPWPEGSFDGWQYGFTWNHLWYLAYLWVYTLLLTALLPLLRIRAGAALQRRVGTMRGAALLLLPTLPAVFLMQTLMPAFPATNAFVNDWFQHALFFGVFVFGFLVARSSTFWEEAVRLRRISLTCALAAGAVYVPALMLAPDEIPEWMLLLMRSLRGVYLWFVLLALLGWSKTLLDRPFRWLPYASEAVYPWYMLHQSATVLLLYWLGPRALGPVLEPLAVIGGTVLACAILHELLIRRIGWLRPLFGLKPRPASARAHAVETA